MKKKVLPPGPGFALHGPGVEYIVLRIASSYETPDRQLLFSNEKQTKCARECPDFTLDGFHFSTIVFARRAYKRVQF